MPQSVSVVFALAGVVLVALALTGGNHQWSGSGVIPPLSTMQRGLAGASGFILILLALYLSTSERQPVSPTTGTTATLGTPLSSNLQTPTVAPNSISTQVADTATILLQLPISYTPTSLAQVASPILPSLIPTSSMLPITPPFEPSQSIQSPTITTVVIMPTVSCESNIGIVSVEQDWRRVILEPDGRIWQDQIRSGNEPYEVSFTAPCTGNMERLFNGANAALLLNGQVIASGGNGIPVTLLAGAQYTVRGGSGNGGFSLELVK